MNVRIPITRGYESYSLLCRVTPYGDEDRMMTGRRAAVDVLRAVAEDGEPVDADAFAGDPEVEYEAVHAWSEQEARR